MKTYVGVKAIKAKPMTHNEFQTQKFGSVDMFTDSDAPGYLVEYDADYQSWSPAEVFEKAYLELDDPTKITKATLERFMINATMEATQLDPKTTLTKVVPSTGFVQYEVSSCVDPKNYDHQLGQEICLKRINDKLWTCLGFVLQWATNGLK